MKKQNETENPPADRGSRLRDSTGGHVALPFTREELVRAIDRAEESQTGD